MRAGASKVISPYTIGANRMAQAILRPSVVDFIEIATASENLELQIEEIANRSQFHPGRKNLDRLRDPAEHGDHHCRHQAG